MTLKLLANQPCILLLATLLTANGSTLQTRRNGNCTAHCTLSLKVCHTMSLLLWLCTAHVQLLTQVPCSICRSRQASPSPVSCASLHRLASAQRLAGLTAQPNHAYKVCTICTFAPSTMLDLGHMLLVVIETQRSLGHGSICDTNSHPS